jgi:hypothetical protein
MKTLAMIVALAVAAPLTFTACDRTVAEKTTSTETPNGTKVEKQETVQHSDGTVTQEKEKTVTNNNP